MRDQIKYCTEPFICNIYRSNQWIIDFKKQRFTCSPIVKSQYSVTNTFVSGSESKINAKLIFISSDPFLEILQGELEKQVDSTKEVTLKEYLDTLEKVRKPHILYDDSRVNTATVAVLPVNI